MDGNVAPRVLAVQLGYGALPVTGTRLSARGRPFYGESRERIMGKNITIAIDPVTCLASVKIGEGPRADVTVTSWATDERGAITVVGTLPDGPPPFAEDIATLWPIFERRRDSYIAERDLRMRVPHPILETERSALARVVMPLLYMIPTDDARHAELRVLLPELVR